MLSTQNASAARDPAVGGRRWRSSPRRSARSDPDLRRLLTAGPPAATELIGLLRDLDPTIGTLLGNLITVNGIAARRLPGIEQILVVYPLVVAGGFTVAPGDGTAHFGLVVSVSDPPCQYHQTGQSGCTPAERANGSGARSSADRTRPDRRRPDGRPRRRRTGTAGARRPAHGERAGRDDGRRLRPGDRPGPRARRAAAAVRRHRRPVPARRRPVLETAAARGPVAVSDAADDLGGCREHRVRDATKRWRRGWSARTTGARWRCGPRAPPAGSRSGTAHAYRARAESARSRLASATGAPTTVEAPRPKPHRIPSPPRTLERIRLVSEPSADAGAAPTQPTSDVPTRVRAGDGGSRPGRCWSCCSPSCGCRHVGRQWYDQRQLDAARQQALAAARQNTVNFVSISAATVDRDLQRISDGATGDFKDEFTQDMAQVRAAVVENKVDSHGTVARRHRLRRPTTPPSYWSPSTPP